MEKKYFLRMDGVKGESRKIGYEDWVEVLSFSSGAGIPPMDRSSVTINNNSFHSFLFTHEIDIATPPMLELCMTGGIIPVIDFVGCVLIAGFLIPVLEIKMENVILSRLSVDSKQASDKELGGKTIEEVEVNFAKISIKVTPINPDNSRGSSVQASFDLTKTEDWQYYQI